MRARYTNVDEKTNSTGRNRKTPICKQVLQNKVQINRQNRDTIKKTRKLLLQDYTMNENTWSQHQ